MIKATSYGELWRNEYLKVKAENEKLREQVLHLTMKIGGSARPQFHTADNPYSGMDFALGAMKAGADARNAVSIAAALDTGTGGKVQSN